MLEAITDLRHAELKRMEQRSNAHIEIEINVSAADYPDLPVADGDTVTRATWVFSDGHLAGQEVLGTLRSYLKRLAALLDEAETKLS